MLNSFGLLDKVIAYVKDKGSNLNILTNALTSVVYYSPLQLACPFVGLCFGHAMFKATQYATNDTKMCVGFSKVNLKGVQTSLQNTIIWTKTPWKRKQEWKDSCIIVSLAIKMLKTPVKTKFASRVILFQETIAYQDAIFICYGWHQMLHLQSRILDCQTWSIVQTITYTLMPIVKKCVLNQSQGYWLLLDALGSTFSLCTIIKVDVCKIQALN